MTKRTLTEMSCQACRGDAPAVDAGRLDELLPQVPEWNLVDGRRISRTFRFPDFASALAFVNRVGELAERESHHPDIHLSWGKVKVELWTHKVGGLTENDFVLAAKIDRI